MSYEVVELLDQEDSLVGYAIKKQGVLKLDSLNIYGPDEEQAIYDEVEQRNERDLIRQHWPMPNEPEVQALLNDPDFDPVQYEEVQVIDYEASDIVYDTKPGPPIGLVDGQMQYGPDEVKYDEAGRPSINPVTSKFVTKTELQPVGVQGKSRIDAACETVARERAGIDGG